MGSRQSMVSRPGSEFRVHVGAENETGVVFTDLDRARIALLGRWYALSLDSIVRAELGPAWMLSPPIDDHGNVHPEYAEAYAHKRRSVRRRLGKLAMIEEIASFDIGPAVGRMVNLRGELVYWSTRVGGRVAQLPWTLKPTINPMSAAHASMAADVGMQVEALGYTVYSEREVRSEVDVTCRDVTVDSASIYINNNQQRITKRPDLVVPAADGESFHAIEVEKVRDRSVSVYAEKLKAYRDNPRVRSVWYICGHELVARRVRAAADQVFGNDTSFTLRVRVIDDTRPWTGIPDLATDRLLLGDLNALGITPTLPGPPQAPPPGGIVRGQKHLTSLPPMADNVRDVADPDTEDDTDPTPRHAEPTPEHRPSEAERRPAAPSAQPPGSPPRDPHHGSRQPPGQGMPPPQWAPQGAPPSPQWAPPSDDSWAPPSDDPWATLHDQTGPPPHHPQR